MDPGHGTLLISRYVGFLQNCPTCATTAYRWIVNTCSNLIISWTFPHIILHISVKIYFNNLFTTNWNFFSFLGLNKFSCDSKRLHSTVIVWLQLSHVQFFYPMVSHEFLWHDLLTLLSWLRTSDNIDKWVMGRLSFTPLILILVLLSLLFQLNHLQTVFYQS